MNILLSPCVPENLVSRDEFSRPVPRQPAHLHTQAESGAYLRDSSRVPRRRPFIRPPYVIGGQSRVYRVTQLRTDGVHCRQSAGTGPVNIKVVPNECWMYVWFVQNKRIHHVWLPTTTTVRMTVQLFLLLLIHTSSVLSLKLKKETTVTQHSHRPIKCQSRLWPQRGTKVNGSHHGDNPLLRPTGIQIATKRYATLQAMAPTNNKTVHQTSLTPYREQPRSTRIVVAYPRPAFSAPNRTDTFQPVLINNSKFLKATHRTKIRKIEIPRSMVVEALSW